MQWDARYCCRRFSIAGFGHNLGPADILDYAGIPDFVGSPDCADILPGSTGSLDSAGILGSVHSGNLSGNVVKGFCDTVEAV